MGVMDEKFYYIMGATNCMLNIWIIDANLGGMAISNKSGG